MPAPQLTLVKKQSITSIFLGIDFGTSFTKVSYSYAPTQTPQIETIRWNDTNSDDAFFKSSVLYIQNERLYFDKPVGESKEVKYFKYSIIETKLKNNSEQTNNNFEEMCCVYFLAQVIKHSLAIIQKELRIANMEDMKISVNMGVPLENFYEEKNRNNMGVYLEILKDAVLLAGGCKVKVTLPSNQVIISNLDSIFSEIKTKRAIPNWSVYVYPELAAELLLYHQSKLVADGVYAVIDIGGGTVDMALFQKKTNGFTKIPEMNCLAQKILPYGIEILQRTSETKKKFQENFALMVIPAKNYSGVNFKNYEKIDVFFLGGGAKDEWYLNNIKGAQTGGNWSSAGIPPLSFSHSIIDFINSEEVLLCKNQRLIISQILARHRDDIINVSGFPNWYKKESKNNPKKNSSEEHEAEMAKLAEASGWDTIG